MFKRGSIWWTKIRREGRKTIVRSLETSDKKLATSIEAKIRTGIIEGKYIEKSACENNTVEEMMTKFMEEHAPNVSVSMQNSYKASLKNINPFFAELQLSAVSPKVISSYKVKREKKGIKPATINRELAMLSKAFNVAVREWEWTKDNPVSRVPREKENNERDRWLSFEDEKRILTYCPDWLKDIIVFDLNTGFRQGELLSLTWQCVNLLRNTAMILARFSKNGKPRTIPLNQIAIEILMRKSNVRSFKNDLVFFNGNGTMIDRHNLRRAFNVATKKAGIADFRFHDLRHTFATRLVQRGIDIYKVSKLLGHKDVRMTQRYSHHCPDSLRDGVDILTSISDSSANFGHNLVTTG